MSTNFATRKGGYVKRPKARLSLWVPQEFYDRLEADSNRYGITKTAMVQNMILDYYRSLDVSLSTARNAADVKGQGPRLWGRDAVGQPLTSD